MTRFLGVVLIFVLAFDLGCSSDGSHPGGGGAIDGGGGGTGGSNAGSGGGGVAGASSGSGGKSNGGSGGDATGGKGGSSGTGAGGSGAGGVPVGGWTNATGNLANMDSECGNLSHVSAKPDEDLLIAGVAQKGLWASSDGGKTWHALGTGGGSDSIVNRLSWIAYDPTDKQRFWESGIYNSGGVYQTTDDGTTFKQLGDVTHDDYVSVDFTDPNRQTLLAGGHEQSQTVHRSTNGGMTWNNVGAGLPANTNSSFPLVIDALTHLVGCAGYGGGPPGIFRTTDGGAHWNQVSQSGGGTAPLLASDGSIYWASPQGHGMVRSTDQGKTWNDAVGNGVVDNIHPVELPDGRLATISYGFQKIVVSSDHGATWGAASTDLPYHDPSGLAYSAQQKAFFIWHFTCGFNGPVPVPADAIMRYDFQ
jgi:hypothetical protein